MFQLLQLRFGTLSDALRTRLQRCPAAELEGLFARAVACPSPEALLD